MPLAYRSARLVICAAEERGSGVDEQRRRGAEDRSVIAVRGMCQRSSFRSESENGIDSGRSARRHVVR